MTTEHGGTDRPAPGLFVVVEGVDGAGKSTLLRAMAACLRQDGREVVETREPGGSAGAEEIRALLVGGAPDRWSATAELLLFNAARRDHLDKTVEPALSRGAIVLSDRFVDSTRAYQAAGRGVAMAQVDALHQLVIGREADLTLILDLDPAAAAARRDVRAKAAVVSRDEERFERFGADFQATLRAAFLELAAQTPERRKVIDASQSAEAVLIDALGHIAARTPVAKGRARE
ncbi:MAG: dTMP kinase [Neomegalonema sp.]|nr:dTMP kinase [Neomegalonema sp.]